MKPPLRVLLVQQSEDEALLIQHALQQNGLRFVFEHATTPEAVQSALGTGTWDVIVAQEHTHTTDGVRWLKALRRIEASLLTTLDLHTVLTRLVRQTRALFNTAQCNLYLPEAAESRLRLITAHADKTEITETSDLPLGNGIIRDITRDGKGRFIQNTEANPAYRLPGMATIPSALLCAPLLASSQVIGLLALTRDVEATPFTQTDLDWLTQLAPQATSAIRNAQVHSAEQKRARELADALERQKAHDHAKDQFIQNVAHDLRTPVAIARGYAELLSNGTLGDLQPDQQEPAAIVTRRLKMLSSLVGDIDALFQAEAASPDFATIDITTLARNAANEFQTLARDANVTLSADLPQSYIHVSGDLVRLRRALDNLLNNALKFTPEDQSITLRVRQQDTRVILEIIDTGIGIPADKLTRIFDRFYQVPSSLSRRQGGHGLGLSLVKQIVEAHHGTIEVTSQLGAGSTFRINLPLRTGDGNV